MALLAAATSARAATPNDRVYPSMYALPLISAPAAWDVTQGSAAVTVAVVDDGIAPSHPDLAPNLAAGHDFGNNDSDPTQAESEHGSQIAALIGAAGNNTIGMTGVSWTVKLMPLKVRTDGPGERLALISSQAEADAFRYAGANGARVANASFGGVNRRSDAVLAAINASPNTLFITSAGNNGADNDAGPRYPCNYDAANLICVAGTDQNDNLATFTLPGGGTASNFGARSVDLAAPGKDIQTVLGGDYGAVDGTSYAAAHVSGVAALYFARYPTATVADARNALLAGTDAKPSLAGKTVTGGRLNAAGTLAIAPAGTPPVTPPRPIFTPTPPGTIPAAGGGGGEAGGGGGGDLPAVTAPGPLARTAESVRVGSGQALRRVLRRGLRVSLRAPIRVSVKIVVRLPRKTARRLRLPRVVGRASARGVRGATTIRVQLRRRAVSRLRRVGRVTFLVSTTMTAAGSSPVTALREVVIRRPSGGGSR